MHVSINSEPFSNVIDFFCFHIIFMWQYLKELFNWEIWMKARLLISINYFVMFIMVFYTYLSVLQKSKERVWFSMWFIIIFNLSTTPCLIHSWFWSYANIRFVIVLDGLLTTLSKYLLVLSVSNLSFFFPFSFSLSEWKYHEPKTTWLQQWATFNHATGSGSQCSRHYHQNLHIILALHVFMNQTSQQHRNQYSSTRSQLQKQVQ